jgi:hypothetical protein
VWQVKRSAPEDITISFLFLELDVFLTRIYSSVLLRICPLRLLFVLDCLWRMRGENWSSDVARSDRAPIDSLLAERIGESNCQVHGMFLSSLEAWPIGQAVRVMNESRR